MRRMEVQRAGAYLFSLLGLFWGRSPGLTNFYFIRHGDSIEDLKDGTYQDLGLSPEGIEQTQALRDRLLRTGEIKADALLASPFPRAQESAQILAPALSVEIVSDDGLKEWVCDDGRASPEEFTARWNQVSEAERPFTRWMEGYETWVEFAARVRETMRRLAQEYDGRTLALVTHGGVIQASFDFFFNLSGSEFPGVAAENASITHWSKPDGRQKWILRRFNDTRHAG